MENNTILDKRGLGKALTLSTRSIDKLVAAGKIPSFKVGTRRLFNRDAVIEALSSGAASPENGGLN